MQKHSTYSQDFPLKQKILYVLSILKKATADEIAMEIMELDGIATEDGVADLARDTKEALDKMQIEHTIKKNSSTDKQAYYFL